jgi:hypothetical protein
MVRKMEVEDIAKIAFIEDHLETHLTCEKGEWVQFLISQVDNPKLHIIGDIDDKGIIKGYMVIVDNIMPPIFDSVVVLFVWTQAGALRCDRDVLRPLIKETQRWAREIGARRGIVSVPVAHSEKFMESVGGKKIAHVFEWQAEEEQG